jgi:hypothetical protein
MKEITLNFVRINLANGKLTDMAVFKKEVEMMPGGTVKEDVSIEPTRVIFDQSDTKDLALQKALLEKLNTVD